MGKLVVPDKHTPLKDSAPRRDSSGTGKDASEFELAEQVAVLCWRSFAFEDLHEEARLVVGVGGEDFALLGGDSGVAFDEGGHATAGGLNVHGQGSDVDE